MGPGGAALDTNSHLSERFRQFARRECRGSSSLYEHLAERIADDAELLRLAAHSNVGQPVPNLFLGAVHYLLLGGIRHPAAEYYPSLVDDPREPSAAFVEFKAFCERYEHEIIPILQGKLVQTNEVRRCAYLYPSFCYIYRITGKPLALIEIGTSAGLQLLWDRYSYSYGTGGTYGNRPSSLEIAAEIRGNTFPPLFEQSPPVTSRVGLDLHINHVTDPENFLWLRALIWPEHHERVYCFDQAVSCLKGQSLELIEGDGVSLLPTIASGVAKDATLCIFHTHVANQIPRESKLKLEEQIRELGRQRDVFHLYNNMWDGDLHLDYIVGGQEYKNTIAKTDGHGRWFEWLL
jgi:hypothetical protein